MQVNFFTLDYSFQSMVDCSVEQGHESKSEKPDDNVLECHPVFRAFIHLQSVYSSFAQAIQFALS
jgi:hypothetical protein